jgi:hypothetical protein
VAVARLAERLQVDPAVLAGYGEREQTRTGHLRLPDVIGKVCQRGQRVSGLLHFLWLGGVISKVQVHRVRPRAGGGGPAGPRTQPAMRRLRCRRELAPAARAGRSPVPARTYTAPVRSVVGTSATSSAAASASRSPVPHSHAHQRPVPGRGFAAVDADAG